MLYYGIFYAGIWGSNTAFGDGIEIDYYAGITPKWGNVTFNFAALYYTYPGAEQRHSAISRRRPARPTRPGTGPLASTTIGRRTISSSSANSNAIEGSVAYAFAGKLFNFFSPTVSGILGYQSYEEIASDYTYWNAGLTLGFMNNFSVDARYYDTDYQRRQSASPISWCDGTTATRASVGTLKAVF